MGRPPAGADEVSTMRGIPHSLAAVLVPAIAALALLAPAAQATNPAKKFPGFAALKDSLGSLPILADVVVVEDVVGNTEKVYLDDVRSLADSLLAWFSDSLDAKGYHVTRRPLLGVGMSLSATKQYRRLENWKRQHRMDEERFPSGPPPLYVDATQCPTPVVQAGFSSLFKRVIAFDASDITLGTFPEVMALRDAIGSDHVLLLSVVSNRVTQGKGFLHAMLSPLPAEVGALSALRPCDEEFNDGVILSPVSSMLCRIAIVDCHDGKVLWADSECQPHTFSENQVGPITANILKHLP
jgi:hypothetical protein